MLAPKVHGRGRQPGRLTDELVEECSGASVSMMWHVRASCSASSAWLTPRRAIRRHAAAASPSTHSSALIADRRPARRTRTPSIASGTFTVATRAVSKRRYRAIADLLGGRESTVPLIARSEQVCNTPHSKLCGFAWSSGARHPAGASPRDGDFRWGSTSAANSSRLRHTISGGPPASGLNVMLPSAGTCSRRARTSARGADHELGRLPEIVDGLGPDPGRGVLARRGSARRSGPRRARTGRSRPRPARDPRPRARTWDRPVSTRKP